MERKDDKDNRWLEGGAGGWTLPEDELPPSDFLPREQPTTGGQAEEEERAKIGVVIVAGGSGKRFGASLPKQFHMLNTLPVLGHTINLFHEAWEKAEIIVVLPKKYVDFWQDFAARFEIAEHHVVEGGKERFYSVKNGINAFTKTPELIAIQDGVRPLGSTDLLHRIADEAQMSGAAIPVIAPADSYREIDHEGGSKIINRQNLRAVQTPQIFQSEILIDAYGQPFDESFTDDASVVERRGQRISLVEGERMNLKITTQEDILLASAYLQLKQEQGKP